MEKVGTHEPMDMNPIGTGPFKVSEIVAEHYAELVANEDWWGGRAIAGKYIFRFLSREAMDAALQAEQIMAGGASSAEAWRRLGEEPHLVAFNRPTIILFALDFNNGRLGDMVHPLCEATLYALDMDALGADLVVTARAKGLRERLVVARHVLRNALLPIVTLFGLSLPGLLGGSFIIETIFSWNGLGLLGYRALMSRDYPLLMGMALMVASMVFLANQLTDIAYVFVDPRVRYG